MLCAESIFTHKVLFSESTLQVREHLVETVAPVLAVHGAGKFPALVAPQVEAWILLDVGLKHVEATARDVEIAVPLRRLRHRHKLQPIDTALRPGHMTVKYLGIQELRYPLRTREYRRVMVQEIHEQMRLPLGTLVGDESCHCRPAGTLAAYQETQDVLHRLIVGTETCAYIHEQTVHTLVM